MNYDPEDDLYAIGYVMRELEEYLHSSIHPDPEYGALKSDLMRRRRDN
jgi:hypothetical protein